MANHTQTGSIDLTSSYSVHQVAQAGFESAAESYATKTEVTQTADSITQQMASEYATKSELGTETSSRQTAIQQVNNAIALKANASDVYTKQQSDGLISTEVANRNAAIEAKASEISLSVSQSYTTKTEFNALEVGGRNLFIGRNQNSTTSTAYGLTITWSKDDLTLTVKGTNTKTDASWGAFYFASTVYDKILFDVGDQVTASFILVSGDAYGLYLGVNFWSATSGVQYAGPYPDAGGHRTFTLPEYHDSTKPCADVFLGVAATTREVDCVLRVKIERGNKATDWTPAPEDQTAYTDAQVSAAKAEIKVTTDGISSEVSKVSSVKYLVGGAATLNEIKGWTAEGYSGPWTIFGGDTSTLRVGDTVYVRLGDTTRNCYVYCKGTVTSVESAGRIYMTSHGYEDVLPVETIKSTINQSSDSVKIQANHVNIEGAAIFTSGRLSETNVASQISTAVDSVEIGGRNHVYNSAGVLASHLESGNEYIAINLGQSYMDIPSGTEVTISFDLVMRVQTASPYLLVYNTNESGPKQFSDTVIYMPDAAGTTINRRVHVTGTLTDRANPGKTDNYLEFYSNYGSGNVFSIANLKMEVGNKATDWTPAPEDYSTTQEMSAAIKDAVDASVENVNLLGEYNLINKDAATYDPSSGTLTSTTTLNTRNGSVYVQLFVNKYTFVRNANDGWGTGEQSLTLTKDSTFDALKVKFNGNMQDASILWDISFIPDGTVFTICVNVESYSSDGLGNGGVISGINLRYGTAVSKWSFAPGDITVKTNAVTRTQRIYYRSNAAITSWSMPTSWVTNDQNTWNGGMSASGWSTKVTPIASGTGESAAKYLYLYTCEQRQMADGTIYHTPVTLDESTTVIDGGNIITHSVTANKIVSHSVSADQLTVGVNDSITNAAQTATNYISIDPVDGIRIANANPGSASTYQRQTSTATEFVVGGERTAQFGGSGAIIGKDDELQLKMTAGAMALENDTDDEVFSVTENASSIITRSADLVTYASSSDVSTTAYTVADSLTAAGTPVVMLTVGEETYSLDSTLATATVTAGTGLTVSLTSSGVAYAQNLMGESVEGGGTDGGSLSVEYNVTHYDAAKLDMDGSQIVTGQGNIIQIVNTDWSNANQSNTMYRATNAVSGKAITMGIGAGGANRGIFDNTTNQWLVYMDDVGVAHIGGKFGTQTNVSGANVSTATSSWTQLASVSLAPGKWLVIVGCYAAANATGRRTWVFTTATAAHAESTRLNANTMPALSSGAVFTHITQYVAPSITTTYRVHGWQNSGGALNMSAYVRAIRIG